MQSRAELLQAIQPTSRMVRLRQAPRRTRMKTKVLYHDNCFDGVASAAVFSRFYYERIRPEAEIFYGGLTHRPDSIFGDVEFNGDENAIVDFKYNSSDSITWWFDHHQSAFLSSEDEEHFH